MRTGRVWSQVTRARMVFRAGLVACLLATVVGTAPAAPAGRVTLDFVEANIVDVLQALATQTGVDIAVSNSVTGTVTLRLRQVSLEQALDMIVRFRGFDYALYQNVYVVGTPQEVQAIVSKVAVEVVNVQYSSPEDLAQSLQENFPGLHTEVTSTGAGLVLRGDPAVVTRAIAFIKVADAAPSAGAAKVVFYEQQYLDPYELQATLAAMFGEDLKITLGPRSLTPQLMSPGKGGGGGGGGALGGGGGGGGGGVPGLGNFLKSPATEGHQIGDKSPEYEAAPIMGLILSGPTPTVTRAVALCKQLDVAPLLLLYKATVVETNIGNNSRAGIDWNLDSVGTIIGELLPAEGTGGSVSDPSDPSASFPSRGSLSVGVIGRTSASTPVSLSAMLSRTDSQILADPTILTLDGREAIIHAGATEFFTLLTSTQTAVFQQAVAFPIGVTLLVNGKITGDDEVTMTLQPVVSSASPSAFSSQFPSIRERRALTTVRVRSGDTIVLGGLRREDIQNVRRSVPLLGDLPLIGDLLFSHKSKTKSSTEVTIFISVQIVKAADRKGVAPVVPAVPIIPSTGGK